jgi:hypothetical protein
MRYLVFLNIKNRDTAIPALKPLDFVVANRSQQRRLLKMASMGTGHDRDSHHTTGAAL